MTTQEPAGRESFTEWGVRWSPAAGLTELHQCDTEEEGRQFMGWLAPEDPGLLVCRTVTRTPWHEPIEVPPPPIPCPEGFHWIGQSFAHCDKCGLPAWDHEGMSTRPPNAGLLDDVTYVLTPWGPGAAEKIRRKWEVTDA